jgi:hypothetical protein
VSDAPFDRWPEESAAAFTNEPRGQSRLTFLFALVAAAAIFAGAFFATNWLTTSPDSPVGEAAQSVLTPGVEIPLALAEIDPSTLTRGGDGSAGVTLAGPGIVPSVENRTSYEILIPRAEMRASVVGLGLTPSGALGAPDNPDVVGWLSDGVAPGQAGNLLLDGHVDYTDIQGQVGPGVAWLVHDVVVGDAIIIRDSQGGVAHIYRVTEALAVAADDPNAVRYLHPSDDPLLTFVTCEGSFDNASFSYADRRIVRAELESTVRLDELPVLGAPDF